MDVLIYMCSETNIPFEYNSLGTDIAVVYLYEIEMNVGKLERKLGEGNVKLSITTGLIITRYQPVDLF